MTAILFPEGTSQAITVEATLTSRRLFGRVQKDFARITEKGGESALEEFFGVVVESVRD